MAKETSKQKQPETITCPACQSSISSDGRQLFKRSEALEDLKGIPELEKEVARIEADNKALKAENEKLKEEIKKHVETVGSEGNGDGEEYEI